MRNSSRPSRFRRSAGHEIGASPLRPSPLRPSPPSKGTKIPLNDDAAEKAKRLEKRSRLRDLQASDIVAAATPARRQTLGEDPRTPRSITVLRGGVAGEGPLDSVTPLRKVPILANFEEWMKLATDNKINATNSWNFALIDYFYDMSLLKDGEGINFQKASCTLDGCVKIYTNRVDSVATETSKLLSGLADSGSKRKDRTEGDDEEGSDGDGGGDDEGSRRPRRRVQRSSEATLAKDFSSIQVKKMDLELNVDPLFKKASADFDEGGAKGLLLNNLAIDSIGRIVFDSSDDNGPLDDNNKDGEEAGPQEEARVEGDAMDEEREDTGIDFNMLRVKFFPNLGVLDHQDICPSLKNFDLGDPAGSLDIPFLKALEDGNGERNNLGDDSPDPPIDDGGFGERPDMVFGFDAGFGIADGGDDDDDDGGMMGFGEGGEAWANETIVDAAQRFMSPAKRPLLGLGGETDEADMDGEYMVGFGATEDILSYFDETLKKNWAGPEHWRIRKLKDNSKPVNAPVRQRKEKETFLIDFMDPQAAVPEDVILPKKGTASINLPKKDWKSKSRNLLPDDRHFNSRQLRRLFLKPKASYSAKGAKGGANASGKQGELPEDPDEEFWARENMAKEIQASSIINLQGNQPAPDVKVIGNYDANFFSDEGLGMSGAPIDDDDEDFADARETLSPPLDGINNTNRHQPVLPAGPSPLETLLHPGGLNGVEFGSQLVTSSRRVRPEYVQYAKIAKKVDVRKLKEKLWDALAFTEPRATMEEDLALPEGAMEEERKFTQIMNGLQDVYPQRAMADISTSYCFICLLHLANEKGLAIAGNETLSELTVKRDPTAEGPDEF